MIDITKHSDSPLLAALEELDAEITKRKLPPIELNVCGGFAMMLHGSRDIDGLTDIDYVGHTLDKKVAEISRAIGIKRNLGADWINNDLMLDGLSPEEFELSTGKLHFLPAFKYKNITVNVLAEEDILRMKVIALDTALTAVDVGGDFTRAKDLIDIERLMKNQGVTTARMAFEYKKYIVNKNTLPILEYYLEHGLSLTQDKITALRPETKAHDSDDHVNWDIFANVFKTDFKSLIGM